MIRIARRRVIAPLCGGLAIAAVCIAPAAALTPASIARAAEAQVERVQFRFPWQSESRPRKRVRRGIRAERPRARKPGPSRAAPAKRSAPPAPAVGEKTRKSTTVGPTAGPLDIAVPRGATAREAETWTILARQLPPPQAVPLLPEDGPAPAPANVLALIPMTRPATVEPDRNAALSDIDGADKPGMAVPLPPIRPAPREEFAPDAARPPLPPVRPGDAVAGVSPATPAEPTAPDVPLPVVAHDEDADCRALAKDGSAEATRLPPIDGPGVCGGGPLVRLDAVRRDDGGKIALEPAPILRCAMARSLADFLRDDVAPAASTQGLELARVEVAGSFQCRGRNGAAGGKMSEHGRANAVDLSGFSFGAGGAFGVFASDLPKPLADSIRTAACRRFNTVLGPGSDGSHETHLHLDLQPRRSETKLCQWGGPEVTAAKPGGATGDAGASHKTNDDRR